MRGRVSDPNQPLRAAHITNAPGFAGGWLLAQAAVEGLTLLSADAALKRYGRRFVRAV